MSDEQAADAAENCSVPVRVVMPDVQLIKHQIWKHHYVCLINGHRQKNVVLVYFL